MMNADLCGNIVLRQSITLFLRRTSFVAPVDFTNVFSSIYLAALRLLTSFKSSGTSKSLITKNIYGHIKSLSSFATVKDKSRKLEFMLLSLVAPTLPTLIDERADVFTPCSIAISLCIWSANLAIGSKLSSIRSVKGPC